MNTVLDIGKAGAELYLPNHERPTIDLPETERIARLTAIVKRYPLQRHEFETTDGVKKSVDVHTLILNDPHTFKLVHALAAYSFAVYARHDDLSQLGMLSPNYDREGQDRFPDIKVIPLREAYPLTANLQLDPRMGTMLAGAATTESKGVGSDVAKRLSTDFEHEPTVYGALSIGDDNVALQHMNHKVRSKSSVVAGLTNGRLGTLYAPDKTISEFPGFAEPTVYRSSRVTARDIIFIPDSFLDTDTSFAGGYETASEIFLGAGVRALFSRVPDAAARVQRLSTLLDRGTAA